MHVHEHEARHNSSVLEETKIEETKIETESTSGPRGRVLTYPARFAHLL